MQKQCPYYGVTQSTQIHLSTSLKEDNHNLSKHIHVYIWAREITPNASLFTFNKNGAQVSVSTPCLPTSAQVSRDLAQVSGRPGASVWRPGAGVRETWRRCPETWPASTQVSRDLAQVSVSTPYLIKTLKI